MDKIVIGEDEEKYFQIGTKLPLDEKEELVRFLKRNLDVFTWSAYEAPGVVLEFICHSLNVNLKAVLGYQRDFLPRMVSQKSSCKEEFREMESMCGFYKSQ